MDIEKISSKAVIFSFGIAVGLFGSRFLGEMNTVIENIVIPFNGSARFAVDNGYVEKGSLAKIGHDSIKKEADRLIIENLR